MENLKDNKVWVMDIETISNIFTYTGINVDTREIVQYVICEWRNDFIEFIKHLKNIRGQVSFNGLSFDYPIIHFILTKLDCESSGNVMASAIYAKAQEIISVQNDDFDRFRHQISEWNMIIPQLDLFKINHFDNRAKTTSLKDLEFWMQYPNVQDMPINHRDVVNSTQFQSILDYNLNDVEATLRFYYLCKYKIELRKQLSKQYGLRLINANDTKIGSDIILDLLSKKSNIDKKELRKLRTGRSSIALGEIILDLVEFRTKEFNKLLESFKSSVIEFTKGSIEQKVIYKGFRYDYGTGGIHGCISPGVYQSDENYVIIDADVASLYPSIAILNGFYPEHLGTNFNQVYKDILDQRIKAKKEGNKAVNEGLKLALNGAYGKSSDKNSFLYDPKFTMSITINGQLLLTMLVESLVTNIDLIVLQVNTDGITVRINRKDVEKYNQLCSVWSSLTKLDLEFVNYDKMVIQDVNNYLAVKKDGTVKYKGLFEINKEFHKDTSFKIVQIAFSDYFVKDIPIEDTIRNHQNIYDFCGRAKFRSDSFGEIRFLKKEESGNFVEVREKQQKTTRYYISSKGSTFFKIYPEKNKESFINKGYQVEIFNKYIEKNIKEYNINYTFYVNECKKIIDSVQNKQLMLL